MIASSIDEVDEDIPLAVDGGTDNAEGRASLLDVVTRCNVYNLRDYLPVYVDQVLVGYAHDDFVSELTFFQQGLSARVELGSHVELAPEAESPEARTR